MPSTSDGYFGTRQFILVWQSFPNATPPVQRALFSAALDFIGDRDFANRVIEVDLRGETSVTREYEIG